ncbi:MAG: N-acetylmuramoyl-L-alanine amidase [Alphaproteobacteria bacterium]|nr:MAG: N-acetylmuramoyl-L-alanine amidase [Alphaproteobacteria bacterium]
MGQPVEVRVFLAAPNFGGYVLFSLFSFQTLNIIRNHYSDYKIKPKLIILHCFNSQHPCFEKQSPFELWRKMNVGPHYIVHKDGSITQCTPDTKDPETVFMIRHAGPSSWKDFADIDHEKHWLTLNYKAIGIEMDSEGYEDPPNKIDKPGKYTDAQITSVKKLVNSLAQKFNIPKALILGHSDISPYRIENGQVVLGKNDPSESFPWDDYAKQKKLTAEEIADKEKFVTEKLIQIGYDLNRDNAVPSEQKHLAIKYCLLAFARHWSPSHLELLKSWDGLIYSQLPIELLEQLKFIAENI